jgi:hypothetical protein
MSKDFQVIDTRIESEGKDFDPSLQDDDYQYFEKSGIGNKHDSDGEEISKSKPVACRTTTLDPSGNKPESISVIVTDLEQGTIVRHEEQIHERNTGAIKRGHPQGAANLDEFTRIETNSRRQQSVGREIHQDIGNATVPMIPVVPMEGTTDNVHHTRQPSSREQRHPTEIKGRPWKLIMLKLSLLFLVIASVVAATVCGLGKCKADKSSQNKTTDSLEDPLETQTPSKNSDSLETQTPSKTSDSLETQTPKAFTTTEELYSAVDEYLLITGTEAANESTVAQTYGYPIGTWNVSQIQNFTRVFDPQRDLEFYDDNNREIGIGTFNEDLTGWDMSNATTLFGMFSYASQFNGDISTWNFSSVTNASHLFFLAEAFDGDLSQWDTSKFETIRCLFVRVRDFVGDSIAKWNTTSIRDFNAAFYEATSFDADLSQWDTSSLTSMFQTFLGATSFTGSSIASWNTSSLQGLSYACE